jgi:predicted lipoprotein with Yx(FWY)xxD motif
MSPSLGRTPWSSSTPQRRPAHAASLRGASALAAVAAVGLLLASCGSTPSSSSTTTTSGPGTGSHGATLHAVVAGGLGSIVVDARGYTVYVLSSGSRRLPCTAAKGCAAIWPPVRLSSGVASAHAGAGIQSGLLGSVQVAGVTYPTYNGWRLYEFSGDSGPGQSRGEGLSSFGGTWHALSASGTPVTSTSATTTTTTPAYPGY